jgi:putative tricarboxylic transport membrane protein
VKEFSFILAGCFIEEIDMWSDILAGYAFAVQPGNLLVLALGTLIGVIFGAFPGLDASIAVALFVPVTVAMSPSQGILLLGAMYTGAVYGGQIPAILFRVPGASESVMTTLDGYEMTKKGQAGLALGTGMVSSLLGGLFGILGLTLVTPFLAEIALTFGPTEYFALGILGLTAIASLGTKSQIKALISGLLGLIMATVGMDSISGCPRFVFDLPELKGGISFIPAIIGLFAVAETYNQIYSGQAFSTLDTGLDGRARVKITFPKLAEWLEMKWSVLRSAVLGLIIGILPGVGATTGAIVGYSQAVQFSNDPKKFGTGAIEGVMAPEVANAATSCGAMVPLLSLGIPGSGTTAIMIAAFLLQGLRPGPLLMTQQKAFAFTIFAGMGLAQFLFCIFGFITIHFFARLRRLPYPLMAAGILAFSAVGANSMGDIYGMKMMFIFAILGFFMERYSFSVAPMILGLVLGPIIEPSLRRALMLTEYNVWEAFSRPITAGLLLLSIFIILSPIIMEFRKKKSATNQA